MYTNVYYEKRSRRIHHWYYDESAGKTVHEICNHERVYYQDCDAKYSNTDLVAYDGHPVKRLVAGMSSNFYSRKKELSEMFDLKGLRSHEFQMSPETAFLQERYFEKDPVYDFKECFNVISIDIETSSEERDENILEAVADPKDPINLITIHNSKTKELFVYSLYDVDLDLNPDYYDGLKIKARDFVSKISLHVITDEAKLIGSAVKKIGELKPDILTGWYINGFDIPYIFNRFAKLIPDVVSDKSTRNGNLINKTWHIPSFPLKKVIFTPNRKNPKIGKWVIPGISILDYLDVYKNMTFTMEPSYKLDVITKKILKEGKLEYDGSISEFWKRDYKKFTEYNIRDVILLPALENTLGFIELTTLLCSTSRIPFEDVFSTIAVATGAITHDLHKQGKVNLDPGFFDWSIDMPLLGGYVFAFPKLWRFIMSNDFTSMYPWIMMMFGISPEKKIYDPNMSREEAHAKGLISCTVDGVYYQKTTPGVDEGVIPSIIRKDFFERKDWKDKSKRLKKLGKLAESTFANNQQLIRKIKINGMYGILGNAYFAYYDLHNANAVTGAGREAIQFFSRAEEKMLKSLTQEDVKRFFPEYNWQNFVGVPKDEPLICTMDTDSSFLSLESLYKQIKTDTKYSDIDMDNPPFLEFAKKVQERILDDFFVEVGKKWASKYNAPACMNFKREKIVTKQLVLKKKKYYSVVLDNEGFTFPEPEIMITGIETKRSDASAFTQKNAGQLLDLIVKYENRDDVIELMKTLKKEFYNYSINDIASKSNVKELEKHSLVLTKSDPYNIRFAKGCPQHYKCALAHNYVVSMNGWSNIAQISSGGMEKMKYCYIDKRNRYGIECIGWIGDFPIEFEKFFKPDYKTQFEKSFLAFATRVFNVMSWGIPNMISKKQSFFK